MVKVVPLNPPPLVAAQDFYKSNGTERHVYNDEPSRTRQEFADECDINKIMERYDGYMPPIPGDRAPQYIDFTEIPEDLMGTMELMHDAENAFMRLPAKVRREFDNNPYMFVDFCADPNNLDQLREWELAPPKPVPQPAPVPVAEVSGSKEPPASPPAPPKGGGTQ